jgi:Heparinase II/III-like protein/Heparinase II/III N-terminus
LRATLKAPRGGLNGGATTNSLMVGKGIWCRTWDRFLAMSGAELQTRAGQEVAKRWDEVLGHLGMRPRECYASPATPLGGGAFPPAHFFFSPSDLPRITALLREKLPVEAARIVAEAGEICQHRFRLLGFTDVNYGPEIDWHLDAVHHKRASRRAWFRIPYLSFEEVGDHKVIWELNRHQHLVTLAKAYQLTGQESFVTELLRQWYHWQRENPYPFGINWASSLEVAFRSLSWLWVSRLLENCAHAPESFRRDLVNGLALSGRHIENYLSTYFSPNTHLLGEGVALFFIGILCPQLASAQRWRVRGWEVVLRQAELQVQPDGMHFEQSVYYHVYALDFFLHARILAAANAVSIPSAFDGTIERMLNALRDLSAAGFPPRFGDDDGGRLFAPRRNRAEHLIDPLATGALLYHRPDWKVAASLPDETLWLLGSEAATEFDELHEARPAPTSVRLSASGIHVMAASEPVPQRLVIDGGPQGPGTSGHSHADALSVQLSVNESDWLVDPGTFCYVSPGGERDLFRGTLAHNTLEVDRLDQAEPAGPFAWKLLPSVSVERWTVGKTFDLFEGSHTGYGRLPDPVIHRRLVFHLKSRFWFVHDLAEGRKVHCLNLSWHFAPGVTASKPSANGPVLFARDNVGRLERLAFLPIEGHGWLQGISRGSFSPVYGRKEPALVLRFSKECVLPEDFAVLVLPSEGSIQDMGVATRLHDRMGNQMSRGIGAGIRTRALDGAGLAGAGPALARGYRYDSPAGRHYLLYSRGEATWRLGPWRSDARFLYCGIAGGGRQHWVLCDGSFVELGGRRLANCQRAVEYCEWIREDVTRLIECPDDSAAPQFSEQGFAGLEAELAEGLEPNASG